MQRLNVPVCCAVHTNTSLYWIWQKRSRKKNKKLNNDDDNDSLFTYNRGASFSKGQRVLPAESCAKGNSWGIFIRVQRKPKQPAAVLSHVTFHTHLAMHDLCSQWGSAWKADRQNNAVTLHNMHMQYVYHVYVYDTVVDERSFYCHVLRFVSSGSRTVSHNETYFSCLALGAAVSSNDRLANVWTADFTSSGPGDEHNPSLERQRHPCELLVPVREHWEQHWTVSGRQQGELPQLQLPGWAVPAVANQRQGFYYLVSLHVLLMQATFFNVWILGKSNVWKCCE